MENLAHSASFHSGEKIAPSKSGIKHLAHVTGEPLLFKGDDFAHTDITSAAPR
jgi:uncharacterized protein with PIN domain